MKNHLIWPVSLVGILSTAVVFGTDMFLLTVGRPALKLASQPAGTEVMGFVHLRGRADAYLGRFGCRVESIVGSVQRDPTSRVLPVVALDADSLRSHI